MWAFGSSSPGAGLDSPPSIRSRLAAAPWRRRGCRAGSRALGTVSLAILFGGTAVVALVLSFLVFLWLGEGADEGKHAAPLWRWIMLNQRITVAITISSAILRIIVSLQASLSTSLVASIVLEKHGISLSSAAQVSVLRSVNSGPHQLAWLLSRSAARPPWLPTVLITAAMLTSVAVQFSSTLLVSDLGYRTLIGNEANTTMVTDMTGDVPLGAANVGGALQRVPVLVPFGEIPTTTTTTSSNDASTKPTTAAAVSDSGLQQRVFVPLSRDNITSLRLYDGRSLAVASRTTCIRPSMLSLRAYFARLPSRTIIQGLWVEGVISFGSSFANAKLVPADCPGGGCFANASSFNCSLPAFDTSWGEEWASMVCLPNINDYNIPFIDTWYTGREPGLHPVSNFSTPTLVFRTNVSVPEWNSILNITRSSPVSAPFPAPESSSGDEWLTYRAVNGSWVQVSLCFQETAANSVQARLSTDRDLAVADPAWDSDALDWDTMAVEAQLGFSDPDRSTKPAQRGLFSVDPDSLVSQKRRTNAAVFLTTMINPTAYVYPNRFNVSFFISKSGQGYRPLRVDDHLAAIFDHVLRSTGRPALALQSLPVAMAGSMMASLLPMMRYTEEIQIIRSGVFLVPAAARGLTAALAIVTASIICNGAIACLYLAHTRYSRSGDYWGAVAQVMSEDTEELLTQAALQGASGPDEKLFDSAGLNPLVRVGRASKSGRVTLVRVEPVDNEGEKNDWQ